VESCRNWWTVWYALIFFLGGLETEIKNLVKMFEPKSLKQAYNLSRCKKTLTSIRNFRNSQPNTPPYLLTTTTGQLNHHLFTKLITLTIHHPLNCQDYYPPLKHQLLLSLWGNQPELSGVLKWKNEEQKVCVFGVTTNSLRGTNVEQKGFTPFA